MSSHQGIANECVLRCTCGRNHGVDKDASLEGESGHEERLIDIAHIKWDNRALCLTDLEALFTETLQGLVGNIPQSLNALGLFLDDVKSLHGSCSGCGCVGCREDVGAAGVTQEIDCIPVGGNEATD